MKILVACEFSGIVREAFRKRGHDAWSCDLLKSEKRGPHIQDDVLKILNLGWDMMIAFPPCTHLASSGARWFKDKVQEQALALEFVRALMNAPIEMICIENPVGVISTEIRKPDQKIQPWHYGHPVCKTTCLWLKNLPLLKPTKYVPFPKKSIFNMAPSPDRGKNRSRTFEGVAEAMASQWGRIIPSSN
jgi:site-specific DNA-cytosine methylase